MKSPYTGIISSSRGAQRSELIRGHWWVINKSVARSAAPGAQNILHVGQGHRLRVYANLSLCYLRSWYGIIDYVFSGNIKIENEFFLNRVYEHDCNSLVAIVASSSLHGLVVMATNST